MGESQRSGAAREPRKRRRRSADNPDYVLILGVRLSSTAFMDRVATFARRRARRPCQEGRRGTTVVLCRFRYQEDANVGAPRRRRREPGASHSQGLYRLNTDSACGLTEEVDAAVVPRHKARSSPERGVLMRYRCGIFRIGGARAYIQWTAMREKVPPPAAISNRSIGTGQIHENRVIMPISD